MIESETINKQTSITKTFIVKNSSKTIPASINESYFYHGYSYKAWLVDNEYNVLDTRDLGQFQLNITANVKYFYDNEDSSQATPWFTENFQINNANDRLFINNKYINIFK